jgi:hypothetical protein
MISYLSLGSKAAMYVTSSIPMKELSPSRPITVGVTTVSPRPLVVDNALLSNPEVVLSVETVGAEDEVQKRDTE